jgi:hypothetical protein
MVLTFRRRRSPFQAIVVLVVLLLIAISPFASSFAVLSSTSFGNNHRRWNLSIRGGSNSNSNSNSDDHHHHRSNAVASSTSNNNNNNNMPPFPKLRIQVQYCGG